MNIVILLVLFGALILEIIMIVKFFELCANVRDLKEKFCAMKNEKESFDVSSITDDGSEIHQGDRALRISDGAKMIVERINGNSFSCRNSDSGSWMGVYTRSEIVPAK